MLDVDDHFHENGNTIIVDFIDDGNIDLSYTVSRKPQGQNNITLENAYASSCLDNHPSDGAVKKLLEFFIVDMS